MMKRLSAGVVLLAVSTFVFASVANAERTVPKPWRDTSDPYRELPGFFRSSAGTSWIAVYDPGTSPCDAGPVTAGGDLIDNRGTTVETVWCFEVPDSLWPAGPGTTRQDTWDHWSINLPPFPAVSRWHITTFHGDALTGAFSAWLGCTDQEPTTPCTDMGFWADPMGYGNAWNESLVLDAQNYGAGSAATLTMSLRYDVECTYDYLYLEYSNSTTTGFVAMDSNGSAPDGIATVFNGASNHPASGTIICENGTEGTRGDGNFHNAPGAPTGPGVHTNELWYHNFSLPVPAGSNLQIRWRGASDMAWSDFDQALGADTDGMASVDNVLLVFANGDTIRDNFNLGNFTTTTVTGGNIDPTIWDRKLGDNTFDGWHLTFDPNYVNKGLTCTFSDDWMWTGKPDGADIPSTENKYYMFLASPIIPIYDGVTRWTGGVLMFSMFGCGPPENDDAFSRMVRTYDPTLGGWSGWSFMVANIGGCTFWNLLNADDLTPFISANSDSLQIAFVMEDFATNGTPEWGSHANSNMIVDNVSIGSFDGSGTLFGGLGLTARFVDTFSLRDFAHTAMFQPREQGQLIRLTSSADSLTVTILDLDGMSLNVPQLHWRWDDRTAPGTNWSAWQGKNMSLAIQDPTRGTGQGEYRIAFGANSGVEDRDPATDNVFLPGETFQYYVRTVDDLGNAAYHPSGADPATTGGPSFFEFTVFPIARNTAGGLPDGVDGNGHPTDSSNPNAHYVFLVDAYTRNVLDFQNSTGFNATGGVGEGAFGTAVVDQSEDLVERALGVMFGATDANGSGDFDLDEMRWDKWDVGAAGFVAAQQHPSGPTASVGGVRSRGGFLTDAGTPYYDAIIYLSGTFGDDFFPDTTRLELITYLSQNGGCFISSGDNVAYLLGSGGVNADSTVGFAANYMGVAFTAAADKNTVDRSLNITGEAGSAFAGVTLGLYGDCPIRREFDRAFASVPAVRTQQTTLRYSGSSDAGDNGRIAGTRAFPAGTGGPGYHLGFGLGALLNDDSRAVILGGILGTDCGWAEVNIPNVSNGVDAPVIANSYGFNLSQAMPNPFSRATSIQFSVPAKSHVSIEVFNILGQKVRTLVNESLEADSYVRDWDGRSDSGTTLASGIYFYKMVAGQFSATKKAVLLK